MYQEKRSNQRPPWAMSDLAQVQTILRSIYTHCTTLCEFTEQAGHVGTSSSALNLWPKHCRQLKHLCCKILVATNNPNNPDCFFGPNRDRFLCDAKVPYVFQMRYCRAGNFQGSNLFVVNIFMVAACTAGKGIRLHLWSSVQPRIPAIRKLTNNSYMLPCVLIV